MKRTLIAVVALALIVLIPIAAGAVPVPGIYNSIDIFGGGPLLTGLGSTWRSGINSGLPHVLHLQSYTLPSGPLGVQWEIACAVENAPYVVQNNLNAQGTGDIIYTSTFTGGIFTFFAGGWPWGDGSGTLLTTSLITTVHFVAYSPTGSRVNGTTSGTFDNGCYLTFAIANGMGMGETSSGPPNLTKPAIYPTFLDGTCNPAQSNQQFGSWGTVTQITLGIQCPVPTEVTTWGAVKARYAD
jgi:hypothetical protein